MGFAAMVLSFIFGIILIILGISFIRKPKTKPVGILMIAVGIVLVMVAVWLGLPK